MTPTVASPPGDLPGTRPVPFSDLIRHPTETVRHLDESWALLLSRRDAADLLLMRADRAEAARTALDVTGSLLGVLARVEPGTLTALLPEALPWTRFLPADDLRTFATDLASTAEACGSLGTFAPLKQLVAEWRHTAEVHADPSVREVLTRDDHHDLGPVAPPAR